MKKIVNTELLLLIRNENNWRQEDAAKMIGIGRSQYANIELGNTYPSIPVLIKLLKAFAISFEELYGMKASKKMIEAKKKKIAELTKQITVLNNSIIT